MIIRRATSSDIPAIFECHHAAVWGKAKSHYNNDVLASWSPGPNETRILAAATEIADANVIHLVAHEGNDLVGFAVAIPPQHEFRALYTKPVAHRGVGTRLCIALLDEVRQTQCSYLDLNASLNAVDFYQRMGAKILQPTDHTFVDGIAMAAMKMRFDLGKGY